jgi:cell division protease FtsH
MVIEYGMSTLGPVNFDVDRERMYGENSQISEEMQAKIDSEIRRIMDQGYINAQKILKANRKKLDMVAETLLVKETLEGDQFDEIMKGKNGNGKKVVTMKSSAVKSTRGTKGIKGTKSN